MVEEIEWDGTCLYCGKNITPKAESVAANLTTRYCSSSHKRDARRARQRAREAAAGAPCGQPNSAKFSNPVTAAQAATKWSRVHGVDSLVPILCVCGKWHVTPIERPDFLLSSRRTPIDVDLTQE